MEIVQASIAVDKLPFTHRAASVAKGSKRTCGNAAQSKAVRMTAKPRFRAADVSTSWKPPSHPKTLRDRTLEGTLKIDHSR